MEAAVNPGLPSTLPALSPKRAIYEVGGFDKNFKLSHFKEYHQESEKKITHRMGENICEPFT